MKKKKTIKTTKTTKTDKRVSELTRRNTELAQIIGQLETDKDFYRTQFENEKIMRTRMGHDLMRLQSDAAQIQQFKISLRNWLRE